MTMLHLMLSVVMQNVAFYFLLCLVLNVAMLNVVAPETTLSIKDPQHKGHSAYTTFSITLFISCHYADCCYDKYYYA